MAFIDYYKIMGVDRSTPQSELRAAYKKRAKQFHPDLHPNDPKAKAKFQALTEAYDVLSDPDKRQKYDQYGENWQQAHAFQANGAGGDPFSGFDFSQFWGGAGGGFSSFFEDLFGGMHQQRPRSAQHRPSAPKEETMQVEIDMFTAVLGGEILIQTPTGKLRLKIKAGTQSGSKVRLREKGNIGANGKAKDIILVYQVKIPTTLSEKQRQLLQEAQQA